MTIKEVGLEYIRFATHTRGNLQARLAFKNENAVYGVYYGGDVDQWIPAKWYYPNGNFRLDGKKSDLDLSLGKEWRKLN